MRDVGPYTRLGRVAGGENCVGEHDLASALVRHGVKEGHTDYQQGYYHPWRSHTATFETL